ncbi:hypothetical protein ACGFOU_08990 [Streptomyces sp. NPDC048595]|uniref:hypothetical protein n=1 Tax=Streptomyces sp. NPDC048595 TaxID=3365576 RepID=UPI003715D719
MHIRHIPLYALAAGALAVTLLLFGGGDGEGADAATGAVTDAVKGAVKGAVRDAVTGATPASDASHPVVVEPATVAPGAAFTVYDGGNCRGESAEAGFGGADIPAIPLTPLDGRSGGTATMPQGIAPGTYPVTVTCGAPGGGPSPAAYGASGDQQSGGDGRQAFAGTVTVSDVSDGAKASGGTDVPDGTDTSGGSSASGGPDDVVPQGGSHTGLGGAARTGPAGTVLGGALLLGAAGWGILTRRRPRGPRG